MKTVVQLIEEQAQTNRKLLCMLEQMLSKSPDGRIEMTTFRGKAKFFLIKGEMKKYLRREESWLIQKLLEKSYCRQLLETIRKNQNAMERFLKDYDPDAPARVYEKLHAHRKEFVAPLAESDEIFVQRWLEEHRKMAAERPNTYPKRGDFVTMNGEIVRSKSEKIIADLLFHLGIPYVYECPLETSGGVIYPDFTILDINTRETYYWERWGREDKEDYVEDNVWKMHLYAEAGIFPGHRLLFSQETGSTPIRTKDVEMMIRTLFL